MLVVEYAGSCTAGEAACSPPGLLPQHGWPLPPSTAPVLPPRTKSEPSSLPQAELATPTQNPTPSFTSLNSTCCGCLPAPHLVLLLLFLQPSNPPGSSARCGIKGSEDHGHVARDPGSCGLSGAVCVGGSQNKQFRCPKLRTPAFLEGLSLIGLIRPRGPSWGQGLSGTVWGTPQLRGGPAEALKRPTWRLMHGSGQPPRS